MSVKRIAALPMVLALAGALAATTPAAADYALAFGKAGARWAFGTSTNAPSVAEAKRRALEGCDWKACKVVMSGRGQCVALSVSRETSSAAWVAAETLQKAREDALVECSATARKCTIQASFCDTGAAAPPAVPAGPPAPVSQPKAAADPRPANRGTPNAPAASPITPEEIARFRDRVRECWIIKADYFPDDTTARIEIALNADGTLSAPPKIIEGSAGEKGAEFALGAVRAVQKCAPYTGFAAHTYAAWKVIELVFRPNMAAK
ncbi:DUF4189 domain-containing protein [Aquabacter spiritensis]